MKEKALLVISFGTSYVQTRERTIGAIERKLAERFPDREVRRAWTSSFIIRKVAKAEGLAIDTPEEALQKLVDAGATDVIVQPTHLSDGYENRRMLGSRTGSSVSLWDGRCWTTKRTGRAWRRSCGRFAATMKLCF